ncbi:MAG TPA: PhzF family phenazine biosynthesis isomerase, partial [Candidatus Sulfotelmatobacter sp.]|nr:PhzF family phenazine biosynthesis isomerase [Candidatus Sulfotelmatobacter sp.]
MPDVILVNVFAAGDGGGNPTPIVLDASGYDETRMLALTRSYGLESTFVFPPTRPAEADFRFRFFVPRQEMNMCGHATVGTLWLLHKAGKLRGTRARIETASGLVHGLIQEPGTPAEYAEISQPAGRVEEIAGREARQAVLDVLGITESALAPLPILNAVTSRMK